MNETGGMLDSFTGINIILDEDLPPDVYEFCNKDKEGNVLYAITLEREL